MIDLKRPAALSINSLVHFVPGQVAYDLVGSLMERLVPGSFLILSSLTADFAPEVIGRAMRAYSSNVIPAEPRSKKQVERFFEGLALVDPGVVAVHAVAAAHRGRHPTTGSRERLLRRGQTLRGERGWTNFPQQSQHRRQQSPTRRYTGCIGSRQAEVPSWAGRAAAHGRRGAPCRP